MFRIGAFSKMGKTPITALRYYDAVGLLRPTQIDPLTNYRFYSTGQLFTLHRIQSLRQLGFSIEEIRLLLSGAEPERAILEKRHQALTQELALRQDQLSRIDFMLQYKEEPMNYVATIKELPPCIVYSKRFTTPSYDAYFDLIPAIGAQVTKQYPDLKCATPEYCYIVYLDGEYKERDIRVEFCEAVTQRKADFDDITFKEVKAVTAVSVMHKGSYPQLRQAYAFTLRWIEENGYQIIANTRESYIDGIWNKENEADWLTELQFPVRKKQ